MKPRYILRLKKDIQDQFNFCYQVKTLILIRSIFSSTNFIYKIIIYLFLIAFLFLHFNGIYKFAILIKLIQYYLNCIQFFHFNEILIFFMFTKQHYMLHQKMVIQKLLNFYYQIQKLMLIYKVFFFIIGFIYEIEIF